MTLRGGVAAAGLCPRSTGLPGRTPRRCTVADSLARIDPDPMDLRFICENCGVKWFIAASRLGSVELNDCARCGGALMPLDQASLVGCGRARADIPRSSRLGP